MLNALKKTLVTALGAAVLFLGVAGNPGKAVAAPFSGCKSVTHVKLGLSIYVTWQLMYYENQVHSLQAEGAKRCVDIQVTEFQNYGASIDAYTSGQLDALVITNMDTLMSPYASGVETTMFALQDYSNGNDGVLSKDKTSVRQLKGQTIYRAQNTVTDYLIEAMLAKNGMSTTDINLANLDDSAHISTFENDDSVRNLGTWNPMTLQLQNFRSPSVPAVHTLFTSHEIPGEIQDWLIVRTNVLKAHPEVGDALAADWYHTTPLVERRDAHAIGIMAATAGSSVQDYTHMLTTTHLYYTATEADQFTTSADMKKFTQKVRDFCYHRGLMGMGHNDANEYGISFSDGTILGNPHDVRLHFDDTWMRKAAHNLLH